MSVCVWSVFECISRACVCVVSERASVCVFECISRACVCVVSERASVCVLSVSHARLCV